MTASRRRRDARYLRGSEIPGIPKITACTINHRTDLGRRGRAVMDRDLSGKSNTVAQLRRANWRVSRIDIIPQADFYPAFRGDEGGFKDVQNFIFVFFGADGGAGLGGIAGFCAAGS